MQFASATSTTSGWNVGSAVAQGATTVYTATKDIGGKVVTSVAKITPTSAQVAKGLSKGLFAGLALSVAQKLIEDGVDFVLDPANNELRYTKKSDAKDKIHPPAYYISGHISLGYFSSADAACASEFVYYQQKDSDYDHSSMSDDSTCNLYDKLNNVINIRHIFYGSFSNDDSKDNDDSKQSIPLTQLASQIIGEANNNNEDAKAITSAVAQSATASNTDDQLVPYTQLSQALDASIPASQDDTKSPPVTNTNTGSQSQTQDQAQDQSKPDESASTPTATPTPAKDIPTDCGFFQTACTWFNWTKDTYTQTKTAVTEYFNPPQENDTVDIDQQDKQNKPDTNISFNGSCPSSITLIDADFLGLPIHWEFQFTDFCIVLSTYVRPILILSGSFSALLIMGGRRDG